MRAAVMSWTEPGSAGDPQGNPPGPDRLTLPPCTELGLAGVPQRRWPRRRTLPVFSRHRSVGMIVPSRITCGTPSLGPLQGLAQVRGPRRPGPR